MRFLAAPEAKICRNKTKNGSHFGFQYAMAAILDFNISNTLDLLIIVGKCFSCPKNMFRHYH